MNAIHRIWRFTLCLAAACALSAQASPPKRWTILDLGTPGAAGSSAKAVNNRGDVALDQTFVSGGNATQRSFIWQNGSLRDLGLPPGVWFTVSWNLNDRGSLVASGATSNGYVALLWEDGAWTQLPFSGTPTGINKFDAMAGSYIAMGERSPRPFMYANGVFTDIGTLGGSSAVARRVNDHGAVVGGSALADGSAHAFLYRDGVMRDLGVPANGHNSNASDVNNQGVAVGTCDFPDDNYRTVACIFEAGAPARALFDRPGLHEAIAINDHGDVVGDFFNGKSFLFEDGAVTVLEEIPAVRDAGWFSLAPADINDRGWIVGTGHRAGASAGHAFLLIPDDQRSAR